MEINEVLAKLTLKELKDSAETIRGLARVLMNDPLENAARVLEAEYVEKRRREETHQPGPAELNQAFLEAGRKS